MRVISGKELRPEENEAVLDRTFFYRTITKQNNNGSAA